MVKQFRHFLGGFFHAVFQPALDHVDAATYIEDTQIVVGFAVELLVVGQPVFEDEFLCDAHAFFLELDLGVFTEQYAADIAFCCDVFEDLLGHLVGFIFLGEVVLVERMDHIFCKLFIDRIEQVILACVMGVKGGAVDVGVLADLLDGDAGDGFFLQEFKQAVFQYHACVFLSSIHINYHSFHEAGDLEAENRPLLLNQHNVQECCATDILKATAC